MLWIVSTPLAAVALLGALTIRQYSLGGPAVKKGPAPAEKEKDAASSANVSTAPTAVENGSPGSRNVDTEKEPVIAGTEEGGASKA